MNPRPLMRAASRGRVAALLVLWLLASGLSAAHAGSGKKSLVIAVDKVGPTQEQLGRAIAMETVHYWMREAPETASGRTRFVRQHIAATATRKAFRAVIDPDGIPRILDGHHRAYALAKIQADYGVPIKVRLDIVKDYRGWSHARYAKHLTGELGVGQFSPM